MAKQRGDPEGRRIAHRSSLRLAEAGRVADALRALLTGAGVTIPEVEKVCAVIKDAELAALQRAHGRIESRRRTKHRSGNPIRDGRRLEHLFVDESGSAVPMTTLGQQPWFALGAVAMTDEQIADYRERADSVKLEFFGTTEITFHEPEMRDA